MEDIIKDMITYANDHHDYEMADFAYRIMDKMQRTFNCPSNWHDIGENMKNDFAGNDWIEENCKMWDF